MLMNKNKYSFKYVIYFLSVVFLFSILLSIYNSKNEKKLSIDFEIDKIECSHAKRCDLYNKEGKNLDLKSYTFFSYHNLQVGDIIKKKSGENGLRVYRKDYRNI